MSNKVYDILKYIALIAIPAIAVFVALLGETWNIPYVAQIVATINGIGVLLGALLQVSNSNYKKINEIKK